MSPAKADADTDFDDRFKFGPAPYQTPEDLQMAYLRQEITEDEFRRGIAKFGVLPGVQFVNKPIPPDRPDTAFETKLPEDLVGTSPQAPHNNEFAVEMVEAKAKLREAARKEAEKDDSVEATRKREQNADWVHDLEEKYIVPVFDDPDVVLNTPGKNSEKAGESKSDSATQKGSGTATATTHSHNK